MKLKNIKIGDQVRFRSTSNIAGSKMNRLGYVNNFNHAKHGTLVIIYGDYNSVYSKDPKDIIEVL